MNQQQNVENNKLQSIENQNRSKSVLTTANKTSVVGKTQLQSKNSKDLSIPLSPSSKNKNLPHAIIQESHENNANLSHNNLGNKGVEKSIAHLQKNQLYASLGNTGLSG